MEIDHIDAILGEPEVIEVQEQVNESVEQEAPELEKPEKPPEEPQEEERKKYVPHAALHEARMKEKEQKARAEAAEARIAEFEKRMKEFEAKQPQEEPDYFTKTETELDQVKQVLGQFLGSQKEVAEHNAFMAKYNASAEAFKQDQPDFTDAYNFLTSSRKNEYLALGYTEEQASQALLADEKSIANRAYQIDKSPAEVLYSLAKQRGYTPKQAEKSVQEIEKSLKASKSLGASGSSAVTDGFDLEEISSLSDKEFEKAWAEYERKQLKS